MVSSEDETTEEARGDEVDSTKNMRCERGRKKRDQSNCGCSLDRTNITDRDAVLSCQQPPTHSATM
ncbi:Hypothetical protein FKW44_012185 [Caligus rogercresseyi]|uniref:Uncharacterized protein n=1 Tax=Caligus rogercresseyi TaxID=217165 RepID=A0A7T8K9C5_CALRO|nr:Hypothetical protein FKW44_012185 [Caligus rogercresseyi]